MKSKSFVYCHQIRAVSTAMLVPDLAMTELDTIRIPYQDLELEAMIGNTIYIYLFSNLICRRGRRSTGIQRHLDTEQDGIYGQPAQGGCY